jgi:hypothetical protein
VEFHQAHNTSLLKTLIIMHSINPILNYSKNLIESGKIMVYFWYPKCNINTTHDRNKLPIAMSWPMSTWFVQV